jgi:hypothetical protein
MSKRINVSRLARHHRVVTVEVDPTVAALRETGKMRGGQKCDL